MTAEKQAVEEVVRKPVGIVLRKYAALLVLISLTACNGDSGSADPQRSNSVDTSTPDEVRRLFDEAQQYDKQNVQIDFNAIFAGFQTSSAAVDDEIIVSWNAPTRRQNRAPLAERDILGYVILFFKESDLAGGILGGRIGSLDEFRERDEQIQRLIPPHEIMNVLVRGSQHLRLISSGSPGSEAIENLAPGNYYLAMSTIDWRGIAGEFSPTFSKTIL